MKRLLVPVGMALALAACGAGSQPSDSNESMPPYPNAPTGWVSLGALGGSGGAGFYGTTLELGGGEVALNAACVGLGSLVVLISPADAGDAGPASSAVFRCGDSGQVAITRSELTGMPIPEVAMIRAYVVEGLGVLRHAAFNVSVEQRTP